MAKMFAYKDCGTDERRDDEGERTGEFYYWINLEDGRYCESFNDYSTREKAIIELEKLLKDEDTPAVINLKWRKINDR
jgi:hypothetical protein